MPPSPPIPPRARRLLTRFREHPPGPFDRDLWTSPLRGAWLSSALSLALLALFTVSLVTGYLSYVAYQPALGANSLTGGGLDRHLFTWTWPTSFSSLYGVTQGLHVIAGVAAIPVVAAKLWAVQPKFYKFPPARSVAQALERVSLALLIASTIFLLFTGVFNIAYWYGALGFSFVPAHFYAAFVFFGSFLAHTLLKTPVMVRAFRERGVLKPLRDDLAHTRPVAPTEEETSAPTRPAAPTVSRRGFLAGVFASAATLVFFLAGETIGGGSRRVALLAPRGQDPGPGPNGFQVNKPAASVGIQPRELTAPRYRLTLQGQRTVRLTRAQLEALPQHTHDLTINCVEGWTTTQRWTGVRVRDLARLAGMERPGSVHVESVERAGEFRQATLSANQIADERTLLALKVNGVDLSIDHGYPARVMVPSGPGVHNTKWVNRMTFGA